MKNTAGATEAIILFNNCFGGQKLGHLLNRCCVKEQQSTVD